VGRSLAAEWTRGGAGTADAAMLSVALRELRTLA
jgi:hypothetical protein